MSYDRLKRGHYWAGADLGIAILDGDFPAPIGDVSNIRSYDFPVQFDLLPGINGPDLFWDKREDISAELIASTERLAKRGARIAFTGCGMFGQYQSEIAASSPIPVGTSSLLQVALALRVIRPEQRVLVLAVGSEWVRSEHLLDCGVHPDELGRVAVHGMQNATHFLGNLMGEIEQFDPAIAEAEVLDALTAALEKEDGIGAIVFECTNLGPYTSVVRERFGLPVWDAISMASWLAAGVDTPTSR
ncbi:aspartate/glutamate racemase family protein [Microbacterium sediminicola]|uniref:Aspartate/glutamate racemase family protein n=1 Tax=Microbacterium sediminicola TaxID=415210 RepID=A0ABN2IAG9_9MICO